METKNGTGMGAHREVSGGSGQGIRWYKWRISEHREIPLASELGGVPSSSMNKEALQTLDPKAPKGRCWWARSPGRERKGAGGAAVS